MPTSTQAAEPAQPPDKWWIYDELCAEVPADKYLTAFSAGLHWFAVQAGGGLGLSMAPLDRQSSPSLAGSLEGRSLGSIAPFSKSWNLADASLGVAAINAHLNTPARVGDWSEQPAFRLQTGCNAFEAMLPRVTGRRVAVIGHFRGLEALASNCHLSILERLPQPGDLPDPACEYILPEAEFVFITATTLLNKTLPRLLELSQQAFVVLVGPTTPMTPLWFHLGVDMIAGTLVQDVACTWRKVLEGGRHQLFAEGTRYVQVERRGTRLGRSVCLAS